MILQGVEAGGHVRGTTPALRLLEEARSALPADYPLLLAGGVAEAADVRVALEAGPTDDGPGTLVDAGALYAGETVARIREVRPAADLVRDLTP